MAATPRPTALCVNGDLSAYEDPAATVPSRSDGDDQFSVGERHCFSELPRISRWAHVIPANTRTNTARHSCSSTLVPIISTSTGYVHNVGSSRLGAAVVVSGMSISSAPSVCDMQMFGGTCAPGCMGELAAVLYPEQHADMHGQTAPAVWYMWVDSEWQEHVHSRVCANDVEMVCGAGGIGQNIRPTTKHTFGQTQFTIEHQTANHQLFSRTNTAARSTACLGDGPPPSHIERLAERGTAASAGLIRRNATSFGSPPSSPTAPSRMTGKPYILSNRTAIQVRDDRVSALLLTMSAMANHSALDRQHREPSPAISLVYDMVASQVVELHAMQDHTVHTERHSFLSHPTVVSGRYRRPSAACRRSANQSAHYGSVLKHALRQSFRPRLATRDVTPTSLPQQLRHHLR
ncbi:unnamed protein product [Tilletia controversa]|nr:unnamed protein product [Tilletia controversa]